MVLVGHIDEFGGVESDLTMHIATWADGLDKAFSNFLDLNLFILDSFP